MNQQKEARLPIAFFDSGFGGVSVLNEAMSLLPNERWLYFADTQYAPYGEQDETWILERSLQIAQFLQQQSIKLLVVACNTATAIAIDAIRQRMDVPVVAIEPAIKTAAKRSYDGTIALLATPHTLQSRRVDDLIQQHKAQHPVLKVLCPKWVEWVESGQLDSDQAYQDVQQVLSPLRDAQHLVLGCTHYPFLLPLIQRIGDEWQTHWDVIDSGLPVAKRIASLLSQLELLMGDAVKLNDNRLHDAVVCYQPTTASVKQLRLFTSGDVVRSQLLFENLCAVNCTDITQSISNERLQFTV